MNAQIQMDDDEPATDPLDIIEEAKKRLALCVEADGDNHRDGLDDLKFLSGDQWDEKARRERQLDGRPCLTINKLPTFLHQVTNDQRQNVPGLKVSAVDGDADVETAEVLQGMIRHMEYSSNADVAYDTAVNSAAAIGFGYFRLVTDYTAPDSFDQEIRFKRIRNPFTVYFDPASEEPDGSDAMFALITSKMDKAEFRRQYPDAEAGAEGFEVGAGDATHNNWLWEDSVRVAEYYRIVNTQATLVQLSNGETGWKDKLVSMPPGVTVMRERVSARRTVEWHKVTALDVLETVEIRCNWIPVFPVYGDELDIDGKVIRSGLIRNAKDPAKMYNFWMTAATEEVALRPKTPYIGAEGTFEGYEEDWAQANVRSFPYLEYRPVTLDGQMAPAPARQPMADIPSGVLMMANHANDNIKATTGLFDASIGNRGNATSGIQEQSQQRQGDIANLHFSDNLNRSIRQAGRCIVSMIPNYYDAERIVKVMGDDGTLDHKTINTPATQNVPQSQAPGAPPAMGQDGQVQQDPETGEMMVAIDTVLHDLSVGTYEVTLRTGPSYSTLRQEAADSMIQFGKSWPKLMDVAGDKVVNSFDWPGAEEIAERIKRTIPPAILGPDQDGAEAPQMVQTPKGPIPAAQAGQMLEQMDQQMQAMGQQLSDAKSGITRIQIETQSRERIAQMEVQAEQAREAARVQAEAAASLEKSKRDADGRAQDNVTKLDIAELQGMVALLVARAKANDALKADVTHTLMSNSIATPTATGADKAQLTQLIQTP